MLSISAASPPCNATVLPHQPLNIVGIAAGGGACAAQRSFRLTHGDRPLRISAERALNCLSGRSLLFIGDSVTRYQYLSLVHFLEHGSFPERCTRAHDPHAKPSLVREKDWGGWPVFYENASRDRLNGREQCDCLAIGSRRTPTGKTARQFRSCAKAIFHNMDRPENRQYSTADGKTNVSFLMSTCGKENLCGWRCDTCWPELPGRFDNLLLNAGIFSGFSAEACYADFMAAARSRFLAPSGDATWKTTNYPAGYTHQRTFRMSGKPSSPCRVAEENAAQGRAASAAGFSVLPLDVLDGLLKRAEAGFNTSMLWDQFHYEPLAYEFANLLYLHHLCRHSGQVGERHGGDGTGSAE